MSMSIVTNVNSMVAQDNMRVNSEFQSRTISRLTSGYRINSSADDAAGMAVANKFRSDTAELVQGVSNANDGVSQLQIADGGLNNISKMLDRLKTLAAQSASSGFTGDRDTLQTEYAKLQTEINRTAANIGLGRGDTQAGRFNTALSVFIGGGSTQDNGKVTVDLSDTSNLVDSIGLALDTTSVSGSSAGVTLTGGADISAATNLLDSDSTQTFHFARASGAKTDVVVTGDTGGLTATEVLTQLNNGLAGTSITASLSSTGKLQFTSSNSFAITVDATVGGGNLVNAAIADNAAVVNTGKYNYAAGTFSNFAGGEAQVLTFTPTGSTSTQISIASGTTVADALVALRNGLSGTGIDVVMTGSGSGTAYISFQSATDFSVSNGSATGAATGGFTGLVDDDLSAAAATQNSATAQTQSTDATADARSALTAIGAALAKLGTTQGRVGAGMNQLRYAIQLANSQIANYSAAESRIRDADIAAEAANLTKAQVMQQASLAAMAQANSAPQAVLALLRG